MKNRRDNFLSKSGAIRIYAGTNKGAARRTIRESAARLAYYDEMIEKEEKGEI